MAYRQFIIKSSRDLVSQTVASVVGFIEKNTVVTGCDCITDIKVVLSELLANAIIHGNSNISEKPIDIKVKTDSDKITLRVTDRGPAFVPDNYYDRGVLCENGRGIRICHILCRKLNYSYEKGKGNSASAVFYIREEKGG